MIFAPSFMSWFIIGMDRASLMSSVFSLNDRPRMAIFCFLVYLGIFCIVLLLCRVVIRIVL